MTRNDGQTYAKDGWRIPSKRSMQKANLYALSQGMSEIYDVAKYYDPGAPGLANHPLVLPKCVCFDAETRLVWVDSTQEYTGIILTCVVCGRDIAISSVPEMPPVRHAKTKRFGIKRKDRKK